jgi:hypothetical protein
VQRKDSEARTMSGLRYIRQGDAVQLLNTRRWRPFGKHALVVSGLSILGLGLLGCGSVDRMQLKPNDSIMPVVNGEDPGQAVGRCLFFGANGPVTTPCPTAVGRFFKKPKVFESDGPGRYGHGVFTRGGITDPLREVVVAYELVTYGSRAVSYRKSVDPAVADDVRTMCEDRANQDLQIITRAFEGCGVTLAGSQRDAFFWSMQSLADEGALLGQPEGFWAQAPDETRPPTTPVCKSRRIVQVEVSPLTRVCARYAADIAEKPVVEPAVEKDGEESTAAFKKTP